jgi:hypothetical protein
MMKLKCSVQVAVVVHAGANLKLDAGMLTYLIPQPIDVLPIVLGSVAGLIVLIGIVVLIGTFPTLLIPLLIAMYAQSLSLA